jgi:hypothetical protein
VLDTAGADVSASYAELLRILDTVDRR